MRVGKKGRKKLCTKGPRNMEIGQNVVSVCGVRVEIKSARAIGDAITNGENETPWLAFTDAVFEWGGFAASSLRKTPTGTHCHSSRHTNGRPTGRIKKKYLHVRWKTRGLFVFLHAVYNRIKVDFSVIIVFIRLIVTKEFLCALCPFLSFIIATIVPCCGGTAEIVRETWKKSISSRCGRRPEYVRCHRTNANEGPTTKTINGQNAKKPNTKTIRANLLKRKNTSLHE